MTLHDIALVLAWAFVVITIISFIFIALHATFTTNTMKSIFFSKTIIGAAIAIAAKAYGFKTGDASNVLDLTTVLWPIILGVFADIGGIIARVKQVNFDAGVFQRPAFWAAILSGLATIAGAFGYDISGLDGVFHKALDNWPAITALFASAWSVIGAVKASQPVSLVK